MIPYLCSTIIKTHNTLLNLNTMVVHNGCTFEIVRFFNGKAVIEIKPINGVFTSGESAIYQTEPAENLTTNNGGGFKEWVKNTF